MSTARPHLWIRSESRPNERRAPVTPDGVGALLAAGHRVTVEESPHRIAPDSAYAAAGAQMAPEGSWPGAPPDAAILGLKELPDDPTPLTHSHVMFGHAYKGQPDGARLLARFRAGGGTLLDLEYLTDARGRRRCAFGYWAGYAGAAVGLLAWAAQRRGGLCPSLTDFPSAHALRDELQATLPIGTRPTAMVIGAKGRVGTGATDLLRHMGTEPLAWDIGETRGRTAFPEVLERDLFVNAILARPGAPVFVPASAGEAPRRLSVIADVACDPRSEYSPVRVYDRETTWDAPAIRVHGDPPLDVTAIDNLPSLLPRESTEDFAAQLLPVLLEWDEDPQGTWDRARRLFGKHSLQ